MNISDQEVHRKCGHAVLLYGWKITPQEAQTEKLDKATLPSRRELRLADNMEGVLGVTADEVAQDSFFVNVFGGSREDWESRRLEVWLKMEKLIADAPKPLTPGFTNSSPLDERMCGILTDGRMRYAKDIVTFDADKQEILHQIIVGHAGVSSPTHIKAQLAQLQLADSEKAVLEKAARKNKEILAEVANMGMCKRETTIQLREEDIIARTVTRSGKGVPRRRTFVSNALNTEAVLGLNKDDIEERWGKLEGPSPGQIKLEAAVPSIGQVKRVI
jgi:hypothetical protein